MTDIPEDVMKVAEGIAGCIPPRVQKVNREFAAIVIARTILTYRAAQAERMADRDLEDAILACERGQTIHDVLANYRAVRRTVQAARALSQEGSDA